MAKEKNKKEKVENSQIDSLLAEIEKDFGKGLVRSGQSLIDNPKYIIPVSPSLDRICGGFSEGSTVMISGPEKCGKAQPLDSLIQTPNGPIKMKDIKIGDEVCTPDGNITKVCGVYPQGLKKIYRITFNNGDYVESCDDHLWEVKSICKKAKKYKVLPLSEIRKTSIKYGNKSHWSIRLPKPIFFYSQEITIDPYLLGILIGDGGLTTKSVNFTTKDNFILKFIERTVKKQYEKHFIVSRNKDIKTCIDFRINKGKSNINLLKKDLKDLGLMGLGSHDKFIPKNYLYNNLETRLSLLQGLIDTDGYVDNRGHISYYSTSAQLIKDVKYLIESLGGICTISNKITYCNKKKFKSYVLYIRKQGNLIYSRLKRKKQRLQKRKKGILKRNISKIEYIGDKECQCIQVENTNGLYLTDHCVITHNTVSSLSFCANAQSPEHGSRPVMILSAEHRLDKKTLTGIEGLKLEEPYLYFVESTKGKILTSSDFLNIGLSFLKNTPNGVLLIDSVSSLVNSKTITDGIGSSDYGSGNRIVSQFLDLAAPIIRSNSCIMIGIVQLYQNTSGWGKKWVEKVAGKYKYQADTILSCDKFSLDHGDGESEPPTGQILEWTCRNSSILSPGRKCQGHIRYGIGIDRKKELMLQAIDLGLIVKGGSWFTFAFLSKDELKDTEYEGKEEVKIQGEEGAYRLLELNPEWYTALNKSLQEMLK